METIDYNNAPNTSRAGQTGTAMKENFDEPDKNRSMDDIDLNQTDENDDYYMETFDNGFASARGNKEEALNMSTNFRDTLVPEPIGMKTL